PHDLPVGTRPIALPAMEQQAHLHDLLGIRLRQSGHVSLLRIRGVRKRAVLYCRPPLVGVELPAHAMQAPNAPASPLAQLNRFPRMVQEFFVALKNALHAERLKRLAALNTKADAEAYVRTIRGKIRESLGLFPAKTPLNARVSRVVERDAYNIEMVVFESRPGFLVSANLYVPKGRPFPFPGVA